MNGHAEPISQFRQIGGGGDDFRMTSHAPLMHYALMKGKCLLHYDPRYHAQMVTANERLKIARENSGYLSATDAANGMGMPVSTYTQHENGIRGFPAKSAPKYARKFKVSEEWLLFGKGEGPAIPVEPSEEDLARLLTEVLEELPVNAKHGDWPRLVAGHLHAQLARFRADREASLNMAQGASPDTLVQSPEPTKPTAQA